MKFKLNKMIKFSQLDSTVKKQRIAILSIEIAMSVASLAIMAYWLSVGDPDKRLMNCLNTAIFGFIPWIVELVVRHRFSPWQHTMFLEMMLVGSFLGSCINLYYFVPYFDVFVHFMSGYFMCILIYGVIVMGMRKAHRKVGPWFMATLIFAFSMGATAVWEIIEFTMDMIFAQNGQGYAPPEIMKEIAERGLTGIKAAMYEIKYVSVLDTDSDMTSHMLGTIIFVGQFVAEYYLRKSAKIKKGMMENIVSDILENKMNKPASEVAEIREVKRAGLDWSEVVLEREEKKESEKLALAYQAVTNDKENCEIEETVNLIKDTAKMPENEKGLKIVAKTDKKTNNPSDNEGNIESNENSNKTNATLSGEEISFVAKTSDSKSKNTARKIASSEVKSKAQSGNASSAKDKKTIATKKPSTKK